MMLWAGLVVAWVAGLAAGLVAASVFFRKRLAQGAKAVTAANRTLETVQHYLNCSVTGKQQLVQMLEAIDRFRRETSIKES